MSEEEKATMEQRVSLITLGVSDVSRAPAFYCVRSRDGHPWELSHNPGWALHANGTISLE